MTPHNVLPPMSHEEMMRMWRAGDSMDTISGKARRQNGLSKAEVREIVMGKR
jgi:hypothetical protein